MSTLSPDLWVLHVLAGGSRVQALVVGAVSGIGCALLASSGLYWLGLALLTLFYVMAWPTDRRADRYLRWKRNRG